MKRLTFVCFPIRENDEKGNLVSAGVGWRENTQINRGRMILAAILIVIGLLAFWLASLMSGLPIARSLFGLITLGCAVVAVWCVLFSPAPERTLSFGVEGWVVAPFGTKYQPNVRFWDFTVADIGSIEVRLPNVPDKQQFRHDVIFFLDSGAVLHVAGDLHPEHAEMVARQLNKAWQEVKATRGDDTISVYAR